ncbi:hypothetical protein [Hymenobacter pini]|uniref:hypothetical protein n=1 Tax=Hymenobacter pini TaxID=2880879 RepID=UPI001CF3EA35|nr:hypothetical protein [Hymenobacter pini]MCA8831943.1 hypothetical protein [Hymenobacter pini]
MKRAVVDTFCKAVEQEDILLFSNDEQWLEPVFEPGQPVPAFTAFIWNKGLDDWFVETGTALDGPTLELLVSKMTTRQLTNV